MALTFRLHATAMRAGLTCRHRVQRQDRPAAIGYSGKCHVLPGKTCRHYKVVFFGNFICK
jgi:hypothetical protein